MQHHCNFFCQYNHKICEHCLQVIYNSILFNLGGSRKIPSIHYAEGVEIPKRSRRLVWRAAVEMCKTMSQLAAQVHFFTSFIDIFAFLLYLLKHIARLCLSSYWPKLAIFLAVIIQEMVYCFR